MSADQVVVGRPAREYMQVGHNGITSAKSYMGSLGKIWFLVGEELGPIEVSAHILRTLRESAEAYLQEEVERAVIGVPA